jgi:uncharacterized protein involved in exopolysaccharide biosynthesis
MAQAPQPEIDHSQIIDFRAMKNWLEFALRASRQRRRLVFSVAGAMFVIAVILVNVIPKTYRVQSRILAQKNSALALRGDTNGESATKSAADLVSRRENVLNLVKQTNLVAEWKAHRGALARAKDAVKGLVSQPMTEQQETDALADYLLTKMLVYNDETSVTFQVDWRDPVMAYRLADALQRGYLDTRHVQEVSSLAEAVSIYEGRASTIRDQVNAAVLELQELRARKQKEEKNKPAEKEPPKEPAADKAAQPGQPAVQPAAAPAEAPEVIEKRQQRIAELGVAIESKERMLNDLESTRVRRLNDLQAKLQELRAVYTEQHPAVTELKQGIISQSQESPQVGHLRDELKQLRAESDQLRVANGGTPGRAGRGGGGRPASVTAGGGLGDVIRIEQESAEERDPEIEYARSKLRFAIQSYQTNAAEIDKTVVDLKTAEAAFKYRYTVVTPPELPKGPIAPKAVPIVLAALIGGLLIGLIGAVALELRQGTLYAPWQVENGLSLRVLSNVSLPALPGKRS